MHPTTTLSLIVEDHLVASMFYLLQGGFMVRARVGCSIEEFLREHYGLNGEYIKKRISTVLLDGEPIDDVDSAMIRNGSTLALSGAMPGLVGAVMRSGSYYSSFRDTITHRESDEGIESKDGMIQVKLFNIVMTELGADFLKRGIFLKSNELRDFLTEQPEPFWHGCRKISLDGKNIEPDLLRDGQFLSGSDLVFFSIEA